MQDFNQYPGVSNQNTDLARAKTPNFVAGDEANPLLPLGNPLLVQAACLGEAGLATVIRFRPMSRAVFSFLMASGLLAKPQVQDALKAKAKTQDIVSALRVLSPHSLIRQAYGGHVPRGLVPALRFVSETNGLNQHDALRLMCWTDPASEADRQRGRLLLEALETLKNHPGHYPAFDYSLLLANIGDLPEESLSLLRLREINTTLELTQQPGGAAGFEFTIGYLARVCSTFEQLKVQIDKDLRAGKPIGRVLRQILEDHADDLPKPRFPAGAALEVLNPGEAAQLSIDWQNCIRGTWLDSMLAGRVTFVRSKTFMLVARLQRVKGQNGEEMWWLAEVAAPHNKRVRASESRPFVLELQRGNVVAEIADDADGSFMASVIDEHCFF